MMVGEIPGRRWRPGKTSSGLPEGSNCEYVMELLIQMPVPSGITLLPKMSPRVCVADTTLPSPSATTKCVVCPCSPARPACPTETLSLLAEDAVADATFAACCSQ